MDSDRHIRAASSGDASSAGGRFRAKSWQDGGDFRLAGRSVQTIQQAGPRARFRAFSGLPLPCPCPAVSVAYRRILARSLACLPACLVGVGVRRSRGPGRAVAPGGQGRMSGFPGGRFLVSVAVAVSVSQTISQDGAGLRFLARFSLLVCRCLALCAWRVPGVSLCAWGRVQESRLALFAFMQTNRKTNIGGLLRRVCRRRWIVALIVASSLRRLAWPGLPVVAVAWRRLRCCSRSAIPALERQGGFFPACKSEGATFKFSSDGGGFQGPGRRSRGSGKAAVTGTSRP